MKKLIGMVLVSALLLTAQPLVFGAENQDNLVPESGNVAENSSIYTSSDTGIQATASYSSRYNKVSVVGKCADVSGAAVNIFIIPEDEDIASLSDSHLPSAADSVITTTGGAYSSEIGMLEKAVGGKYKVYVYSNYGETVTEFMYVSAEKAKAVLPLINGAAGAADMKKVLEENAEKIGLDAIVFNLDKELIAGIVFSHKPAGGFTDVQDFLDLLTMAQSTVKILNGKDAGEEFLSISQILIEKDASGAVLIDCANDYQGLSSEVKAAYTKYLRKEDLTSSKSMARIFREAGILASFKVAKNWTVVKNTVLGTEGSSEKVINNNFKILNPDVTNYNKLKNKDKVFEGMYAQQSTTNNIAAIISAFESIAGDEYNNGNKESGGSSNSGNGSSGNPKNGNTSSTIEGNGPTENPSKDKTFTDMEGHWAAAQVKQLAEKGVISGFPDGSFQPENPVTRAEFTKMILEAFGISKNGKTTFQDVPSTEWFAEYVAAAADKGIVTGAENNLFLPNASITRQDAAVILYRCLSSYLTIEKGSTVFADLNSIAEYAREAVRDLASISIINGVGSNKFDPEGITTRAQAATLISNALDYMAAH